MPIGTRHRITGKLVDSTRGLVVEIEDGGAFALDTDENARTLLGQRVIVEGVRSGFDRLSVDWIGPA